jgi:hypothetical protein
MKIFSISVILTLLLPTWANAQSSYIGIETSVAYADNQVPETAQSIANTVGSTVFYTYNPVTAAFRIYGGHRIDPLMRLEAGYFRTSNLTANYRFISFGSYAYATESYSVSGVDTALLLHPQNSGWFGRVGVHASQLNASASYTDNRYRASIGLQRSGFGTLVGLGYEYDRDTQNAIRYGWTRYMGVGGGSGANMDFISAAWMMKF